MLRRREDIRSLFIVGIYFGATLVAWMLRPRGWELMPTVLGLGWLSWLVATITHNTIHCPIFRSKPLNRIFQIVLTLGYGHPVSAYVPGHNLSHHRHTQKAEDVMRTTKLRYRWNVLNALFFLPTVAPSIAVNDRKFITAMKHVKPRWYRQLRIEGLVLFVVSVALLVLDWQNFLLFFFVPHVVAAVGIIGINYLQHDGCDEDDEYNHSRNFTGAFLNYVTCNNGYHTVHHMRPGQHWSLLPEVHREQVLPHIDPRLDEPSILAYIWKALIWPGKRLRYDGAPVVLPPPMKDVSWVPDASVPDDMSMGAES
jgi:fatty acid desaturase